MVNPAANHLAWDEGHHGITAQLGKFKGLQLGKHMILLFSWGHHIVAIEAMAIEIVDLSSYKMVDLSSSFVVHVYQAGYLKSKKTP